MTANPRDCPISPQAILFVCEMCFTQRYNTASPGCWLLLPAPPDPQNKPLSPQSTSWGTKANQDGALGRVGAHGQGRGLPQPTRSPLESSGMRLTALSTSTRSFCSEGRYSALMVTAPYFSELASSCTVQRSIRSRACVMGYRGAEGHPLGCNKPQRRGKPTPKAPGLGEPMVGKCCSGGVHQQRGGLGKGLGAAS